MGEILYRYWQRHDGRFGHEDHVSLGGENLNNMSAQERPDDTLLRSRFFPRFEAEVLGSKKPPDDWWVQTQVYFVAWFDRYGFDQNIPDPYSDDRRIIATGELTPHFQASTATAGNYYVVWDTNAQPIESFAKRRQDESGVIAYGTVYSALIVTNWTFSIYTAGQYTIGLGGTCSAETLWGSRSHP